MEKFNFKEVAVRLKNLRELLEIDPQVLADKAGVSLSDYSNCENGDCDFSFNFIYNCAQVLGCDITELIRGESARLTSFEFNRAGDGMPIIRRSGFNYLHLAANIKGRMSEPFVVTAPFNEGDENKPIALSTHNGQEFDYVLEGSLKVSVDGHEMVLGKGDSVYYDSSKPHGMIAVGGAECKFLAIVLSK